MRGSNISPPPPPGGAKRLCIFILVMCIMFLSPGCKLGGNLTSPDTSNQLTEPFAPFQPGTPLSSPRAGWDAGDEAPDTTNVYLEFTSPQEIIQYEYPRKLTTLQIPEFTAKLNNFDSAVDESMFNCFIDGEKAEKKLDAGGHVISFAPSGILSDGFHEVLVYFTGNDAMVAALISFEVCTKPPTINMVMYNTDKGLVRVCFDRQIESAYALNMANWNINSTSGIFSGGSMPKYGDGTQVILRIPSFDLLPSAVGKGYTLGFNSKEGLVETLISEGPLDDFGGHDGESEGCGERVGQANLCADCGLISVDLPCNPHVSKQHELHAAAYRLINPRRCAMIMRERFSYQIVGVDPFYDIRDPVGSFWQDEDTSTYSPEIHVEDDTWSIPPQSGCYQLFFGKNTFVQGLAYDFSAYCGEPLAWHSKGTVTEGNFPSDIDNCDFLGGGPQILAGPEAAAWLVGQRAAYAGDPQFGVHIGSESFWSDVIAEMQANPCTFYAVGATRDNHVNHWDSFSHPWVTDVLDYNGNYLLPALPMQFPYLMVVDEPNLCNNESYPWVGPNCSQVFGFEDGMWQDELVFGFMDLSTVLDSNFPPQAVRLRCWDDLGNWKRSDNVLDPFTGTNYQADVAFYQQGPDGLERLGYCTSPLVSRQVTGACTLDIAVWVRNVPPFIPYEYVEITISNQTDVNWPPGCAHNLNLPLYPMPHSDPLYSEMENLFAVPEGEPDCHNEFYTRGDIVSCPRLMVTDTYLTAAPQAPQDRLTQPYLWVSHREFSAWFTEQQQRDSANLYSCEHSPAFLPPIVYGHTQGQFQTNCGNPVEICWNSLKNIPIGGVARVLASGAGPDLWADIGVQSETDLLFINSHFAANSNQNDWQGFCKFRASPLGNVYPGDCPSGPLSPPPIWDFRWVDFSGHLTDDCEWIATTGCESLETHAEGLYAAHDLITDGTVETIAGFKELCIQGPDYPIFADYNIRLNQCDGTADQILWRYTCPTTDCNVISWMEAFCSARRQEKLDPKARQPEFVRAIDNGRKYDLVVATKHVFQFLWYDKYLEDLYIIDTPII